MVGNNFQFIFALLACEVVPLYAGVALEDFVPFGAEAGDTDLTVLHDYDLHLPRHMPFFGLKDNALVHVIPFGFVSFKIRDFLDMHLPGDEGFPAQVPMVAAFWTDILILETSNVWARVTTDEEEIMNKLSGDVRKAFGKTCFHGRMMMVLTWRNVVRYGDHMTVPLVGILDFQLVIISSDESSYAFIYYHNLGTDTAWPQSAVAGYNYEGLGSFYSFSLPGSFSHDASFNADRSNVGIPGVWMLDLTEGRSTIGNLTDPDVPLIPENYCIGKSGNPPFYPHPCECGWFVSCLNGIVNEVKKCPEGLNFHPDLKVCVWKTQYTCDSSSAAYFCSGKQDGNYKDPENCYGYVSCSASLSHFQYCPPPLQYNAQQDYCDWPPNVQC